MENRNRKRQLLKMKFSATILLLMMTCFFIASCLYNRTGIWEWIGAFSEAATIGALADWFAVVALFRRPLGLPIPRTAIIAKNKNKIAENLAVFIRDHFLSRKTITTQLHNWKPARRMATWFSSRKKADFLANKTVHLLSEVLEIIDERYIRKLLRDKISKRLEELDLNRLTGQFMEILTRNNEHQILLDAGLRRLSFILAEPGTRRQLATVIIEVSRREYPRLTRMLGLVMNTEEFGMRVAGTMLESFQGWLHDIGRDPVHPRRKQFDDLIDRFISRIKEDPEYDARIENWKRQFIKTPAIAEYTETLWIHFCQWIQKDTEDTGSGMKHQLSRAFRRLGRWMQGNPVMMEFINQEMIRIMWGMSKTIRSITVRHIEHTVKNWDSRQMVNELELSIGKDLQFIRINGTLVGGLAGLLLHAAVVMISL